jgi:hypothetical protein
MIKDVTDLLMFISAIILCVFVMFATLFVFRLRHCRMKGHDWRMGEGTTGWQCRRCGKEFWQAQ